MISTSVDRFRGELPSEGAAVDHELLVGQVPGGVRDQEADDVGHLLGCAHVSERRAGVQGADVVDVDERLQDLQLGGLNTHEKTPNTLAYTGNVVLSLPTHSSVVPYVTGGLGGLTMFEKASLGINRAETFLTGNAGGGLKWYAPNNRWGLRGDYRFTYVWSKDDAPDFFGRDDRYGHRVYGGVIINVLR